MKNEFDAIDNSLDIEPSFSEIVPSTESGIRKTPKKGGEHETDYDYEYTRGQLYSLIEKGQEAIDGIMDIAQQSDSPRAYEVAGQLIKNVADTTDKLLDLQAKLKKLKEEEGPKTVTTNNTMFIGSTSELQKLLKNGLPKE